MFHERQRFSTVACSIPFVLSFDDTPGPQIKRRGSTPFVIVIVTLSP